MSDNPTITQQYSFAVGDDGETEGIEPTEESVETSLETFGADVDHRKRDSQIDQPEATSFGVDDRPEVTSNDGGEQGALFADTTDDQRTLTGERAASQCLFGTDDTPDGGTNSESDDRDDEPTLRAVATDGGHVEDDDTQPADADASETVMVAIPRKELAGVADALDAERETIERNAGEGPKTEELTQHVEECHTALSELDDNDDNGHISRVGAAGAADGLEAAAETETGDYAEELRDLADLLRETLHDESTETTTFDPYQHVPDEIDIITADGIEQVHDHLSDDNAAEYAEASVEEQAAFLWKMVDQGVIDLSVGR